MRPTWQRSAFTVVMKPGCVPCGQDEGHEPARPGDGQGEGVDDVERHSLDHRLDLLGAVDDDNRLLGTSRRAWTSFWKFRLTDRMTSGTPSTVNTGVLAALTISGSWNASKSTAGGGDWVGSTHKPVNVTRRTGMPWALT